MTKDEKKQRIAEIFTNCYESHETNGLQTSFVKLADLLNEPLDGLPVQFSAQKVWYWKRGESIPLPTPFMLLKQFTNETDWRHELAVEVLEVIG